MTIALVPAEYVEKVWDEIKDHTERASQHGRGRYTADGIKHWLVSGRMQLWIILNGAAIVAAGATEIVEYPRRRLLAIRFLGGRGFVEWMTEAIETLERFARDQGCDGIEVIGRKGWTRRLAPLGFEPTFYSFEKDFRDAG